MCLTRIPIGFLVGVTAPTSPTTWEELPEPLLLGACEVRRRDLRPLCALLYVCLSYLGQLRLGPLNLGCQILILSIFCHFSGFHIPKLSSVGPLYMPYNVTQLT